MGAAPQIVRETPISIQRPCMQQHKYRSSCYISLEKSLQVHIAYAYLFVWDCLQGWADCSQYTKVLSTYKYIRVLFKQAKWALSAAAVSYCHPLLKTVHHYHSRSKLSCFASQVMIVFRY